MTWIFLSWMLSQLFVMDPTSMAPASDGWTMDGGSGQPPTAHDGGSGQPPTGLDGGSGQPPTKLDGGSGQPPTLK